MELNNTKPVFICSGIGGWYRHGIDRLERSLIHHGSVADFLFFRDEYPPDSPPHNENPYAFKIYGIREAIRRGYKVMCHIDASFWAIRNPDSIFDIINEHGNFGFRSGYNCGQTCTDALLTDVGISRDVAWDVPETASGLVGLNIENPKGKAVFEYWSEFCDKGLFINSRNHDLNDSHDPRFLFGRQDQSCYAMALYKAGVEFSYTDYVAYYNSGNPGYNPEKCYFFIGGL